MSFMPRCNFSQRLLDLAELPVNQEYKGAILARANQLDNMICQFVMDRTQENKERMLLTWSVAHEAYAELTGKMLRAD